MGTVASGDSFLCSQSIRREAITGPPEVLWMKMFAEATLKEILQNMSATLPAELSNDSTGYMVNHTSRKADDGLL